MYMHGDFIHTSKGDNRISTSITVITVTDSIAG
jgi:hypothetical protein